MDNKTFLSQFDQAMRFNSLFCFFCNCEIRYSGRAEAFLPAGDRLIIIKKDRVLLIHQPENGTPINYLKAGAEIRIERANDTGHLVLRARSGKDFLDVDLLKIYDVMHRVLDDGQKQILQGNERDMSDMIKNNPALINPNFVPLSREEHTKFGFIDVFGHDGAGNMIVIECKRYTASLSCVTQLRRYVEKIKELKGIENVKGILASPSISVNALDMLQKWGFEHVVVHPPKRLERYNKDQACLDSFFS